MNILLLYYQRTHSIPDEMLWKQEAINQELFMRDTIGLSLLRSPVFVVGEHTSKSIKLPVYGIVLRNGIKVVLSYNFHIWVVSVELPEPIELPVGLFSEGVCERVPFCYGFQDKWKYGPYKPDSLKFTVGIDNEYKVYTLLFLLKNAFPDKIFTGDLLTSKDISTNIDLIYLANGFYCLRDVKEELGLKISCLQREMKGFEIFPRILGLDNEIPEVAAEYILSDPNVLQEYLIEENAFKTEF